MAEQFSGSVEILDAASNLAIELDGDSKNIRIRRIEDGSLVQTIRIDGANGNIHLGGDGHDGDLFLNSADGVQTIHLSGDSANITLGGGDHAGDIRLKRKNNHETIHLDGEEGDLVLGGNGRHGHVVLKSSDDGQTVLISGKHGNITLGGGGGRDGDLFLLTADGGQTFHLDGGSAHFRLGGAGQPGDFFVQTANDVQTIRLSGAHGNITLGAAGQDGDLLLRNSAGVVTIHLDGDTGAIDVTGGDCAERFDLAPACAAEAGTVLVMDETGDLRPCARAYDKRVVGVVSGGGSLRPGVILDSLREDGVPVALVGKVFCKVDATAAAVEVGDLLTTSAEAGHAMKATEPQRAFGAVLGKAMAGLSEGRGLLPVLVALQ